MTVRTFATLLLALTLLPIPALAAGPLATPIEGISLKGEWTIPMNLKTLVGKTVTLVLQSGTTYTGTVKEVGEDLVRIEAIRGKELFDALVANDQIEAIEVQVREIKR